MPPVIYDASSEEDDGPPISSRTKNGFMEKSPYTWEPTTAYGRTGPTTKDGHPVLKPNGLPLTFVDIMLNYSKIDKIPELLTHYRHNGLMKDEKAQRKKEQKDEDEDSDKDSDEDSDKDSDGDSKEQSRSSKASFSRNKFRR